jgi:hypothetical protein
MECEGPTGDPDYHRRPAGPRSGIRILSIRRSSPVPAHCCKTSALPTVSGLNASRSPAAQRHGWRGRDDRDRSCRALNVCVAVRYGCDLDDLLAGRGSTGGLSRITEEFREERLAPDSHLHIAQGVSDLLCKRAAGSLIVLSAR